MAGPDIPRWAGNLPPDTSSFIGRAGELDGITKLLSHSRLVTLTGVRGIGKTRLARRAAEGLRGDYPQGAWFVDLSGLSDPELLPLVVTWALRAQDQTARPAAEALADYLAGKRLLLVLDSAQEHRAACANLLRTLLPAADGLRVLVTATEPLGVPGESVLPVPPLTLPEPGRGGEAEAMRLLLDRMRDALDAAGAAAGAGPDAGPPDDPAMDPAGDPGTDPQADPDRGGGEAGAPPAARHDPADLAELCRMLGGIPLGIELAAARLARMPAHLAVAGLGKWLARHEDAPGVITPAGRLRATLDWTHELCDEPERRLWAELSVFAPGFDAQAAEHVFRHAGPGGGRAAPLGRLVRAGLVVAEQADEVRYRVPGAVAEHGRQRLWERGETSLVLERHRDFYLRRIREGEIAWSGGEQVRWYRRLNRDLPNIRTALAFCLRRPAEHEAGLFMACSLWYLWVAAGLLREGRHYLDRLLRVATAPSATRTKALWVCGSVAALQGDLDGAHRRAIECLGRADHEGDLAADGYGRHLLGTIALLSGDHGTATNRLAEAVGRHRTTGELTPGLLLGLPQLAMACEHTGERGQARDLLAEALAKCNEAGELWARGIVVHVRGLVEHGAGNFDTAWADARYALRIKRLFEDVAGSAQCLELLAWVSAGQGHPERAARLLGAAREIWHVFGLSPAGAAYELPQHRECERVVRDTLGPEVYEAMLDEGRRLDLGDAIAYALGEDISR
mgnify:CR=1 FL=1